MKVNQCNYLTTPTKKLHYMNILETKLNLMIPNLSDDSDIRKSTVKKFTEVEDKII